MKDLFHEFYRSNNINIFSLEEDSIIIFDTNVLLDLYRFSKPSSEILLKSIERVSNLIFVPHQVALEFNFNKKLISDKSKQKINNLEKNYNTNWENLHDTFKDSFEVLEIRSSDFTEKQDSVIAEIKKEFKMLQKKIEKSSFKEMKNFIQNDYDKITRELLSVLDKKVGRAYTQEEINNIELEGKERYLKKIPPGYGDVKDKEGMYKTYRDVRYHSVYGDLIVWNQIIEKAKEENIKNVIIITNDTKKDDWFYHTISKNNPIGPRIELISELKLKADAELFMYTSYQLIDQFTNFEGEIITLDEFENTSKDIHEDIQNELRHISEIRYRVFMLEKEYKNAASIESIISIRGNLINLSEEIEYLIDIYEKREFDERTQINVDRLLGRLYVLRHNVLTLDKQIYRKIKTTEN
ncbi:PIN-like domain-containing protein [Carnobacterium maltaromaticum]|uniref:PIN-like domain-containing protein n=1 Tax=Carnobacterium maltaromaticum TaxID=2751 RepID=UPI0039BE392A